LEDDSDDDSGEEILEEDDYLEELEKEIGVDGFTMNFYFALGAGVVAVLIVLLFFYLFLRGPKNRWEKR